jgi:probable phosphoglycerate mutase
MSETLLYLMRHGQIEQSEPRRFVGQRDLPLDAVGLEQAARMRDWLAGAPFTFALSSDLVRCQETARTVLGERSIALETTSMLREITLGEWEGRGVDEVRVACPEEWARRGADLAGYRPPKGESFQDLFDRVWPVFEAAAARPGPGLLVAHAGVNRVVLCKLLGLPLQELFRLGQSYACVNLIRRRESGFVVETMNAAAWPPSSG